jgi:hypothetical protein
MQNNILTKQLNHMIEKDGLLFASAVDNKSVPINLTESYKHFINSMNSCPCQARAKPLIEKPKTKE